MSKELEFSVVIEKDEDGYFVASVPALRGCHTQAKSLDLPAGSDQVKCLY